MHNIIVIGHSHYCITTLNCGWNPIYANLKVIENRNGQGTITQ